METESLKRKQQKQKYAENEIKTTQNITTTTTDEGDNNNAREKHGYWKTQGKTSKYLLSYINVKYTY
jgi:hypothetical protein